LSNVSPPPIHIHGMTGSLGQTCAEATSLGTSRLALSESGNFGSAPK
jgi:hypothetical protein